ncbi:MAG: hypothetical protein LBV02_00170 [Bacteroidales bacterium]|nr:hypothetical protein [Bacteroidales bacterium]
MTDYTLHDTDTEDIDTLLISIEKSFGIKFGKTELAHIATFGELCDHIANRIPLEHSDDCTTQQAFYKLRKAISSIFKIDSETVSTDRQLIDIFPRQKRRTMMVELEKHLGFKLNLLRAPHWVTLILLILLPASLVGLYFHWQTGVSGLIFSLCGLIVTNKIGIELEVRTVGELAKKMTGENYLKSRRNSNTFNKNEIEKVLTDLFSYELGLDKSKLSRDAKFV